MKLKAIFLSGIISASILSANVYADEITVDMTTTVTTSTTVAVTELTESNTAVIHGSSTSVLTVDFMENSNTDDASSETTDTDVTEKSDGKKNIWSNILLIVIAIVLFGVLAFVWEYFILPWWSHK